MMTNNVSEPDPIDYDALLRRKLVWDLMPCPAAVKALQANGLTPGSPEGNEVEHQASHARLNNVNSIAQKVEHVGRMAGRIGAKGILDTHGGVPELDSEAFSTMVENIAAATSLVVIANLSDPMARVQNGVPQ